MSQTLLIDAAFGRPVPRFPVWFMRQAGRYLKEYRAVREQSGGFLDMCRTPEIAAEISIQPYRLLNVDAVIMFSDILTPLIGMGVELDFVPGPAIQNPVKSIDDIRRLKSPDPSDNTGYVGALLRMLRTELKDKVPVIGFAGSPFTLAAYITGQEAGAKTNAIKQLMHSERAAYDLLMSKLTNSTIDYLNYQIECGAQVIQLFDTWAGEMRASDYERFVLPYIQTIFSRLALKKTVPQIYFVNGSAHLLSQMAKTGADVLSVDWRTDLGDAFAASDGLGVQGNLDPFYLFAADETLKTEVARIITGAMKHGQRFVFNLGHGIHKNTDPRKAKLAIDTVRNYAF